MTVPTPRAGRRQSGWPAGPCGLVPGSDRRLAIERLHGRAKIEDAADGIQVRDRKAPADEMATALDQGALEHPQGLKGAKIPSTPISRDGSMKIAL